MPTGDVETYYQGELWHNRIQGTGEVFGTTRNRGAAIWAGRERARKDATAHAIRGDDGEIVQRHSYTDTDRPAIFGGFQEPRSRGH